MKVALIFLCSIIQAAVVFADSGSTKKSELFFPVEKNHIQILPQRFEYHLLNKDQIQIGNALFDANRIDFQILPIGGSKTRYKLRFRWPANLLNQGEIAIKDNSGKGIWFQKIKQDSIQYSKDKSIALYDTEIGAPALIKSVQLYPFFRFCIHREEPLTKIYLCSKDLYLRNQKNQISILSRDSYRPDSFVEVNGRTVGEQGVIFLNDPSESISLRSLLLSGATLEIDTRMKILNFKDVHLSDDGKQIVVKAQGTEPVDPNAVEKVPGNAPDEWQTHLDIERPFVYVKGEGDLPLRQEFLIRGPVRTDDVKVEVTSKPYLFTYQDEESFQLKTPQGLTLVPSELTKLDKIRSNEYQWTLTGLEKSKTNRRYVKVQSEKETFTAAYDIERRPPTDASFRVFLPFWSQANILHTPYPQWGFTGRFDTQFETESTLRIWTVTTQYRFPYGAHLRDQMYWVDLSAQLFQTDPRNFSFLGVGAGAELKSPKYWSSLFPWTLVTVRAPLMSLSSGETVKTSYELDVFLRSPITPTFYWELGARTHTYSFEFDGTTYTSEKSYGIIGIGSIF